MPVLAALSRDRPDLTPKINLSGSKSGYFTYPLACDETEPNHSADIGSDLGEAMPYGADFMIG
jgi:hypothetical protein